MFDAANHTKSAGKKQAKAPKCYPFYTSIKDTQGPAKYLNLSEFVQMVKTPRIGAKNKAPVVTPYKADGKKKEHALEALFYAVVVDHDTDNKTAEGIKEIYDPYGMGYLAFTTSSHQLPGKGNRWKVLIPLAHPVDHGRWVEIAKGASLKMDADAAQARTCQVFYQPNILDKKSAYEFIDKTDMPFVDLSKTTHDFVSDCFNAYNTDEARKDTKAVSATPKPRPKVNGIITHGSIIDLVNQSFSLSDVLIRNGYEQHGQKYLAPKSESGDPGVVLLNDGRCYSHHGTEDPLSNLNNDSHSLSCFYTICILEYSGDVSMAVKELSNIVDSEGNTRRRRAFMKGKDQDASQGQEETDAGSIDQVEQVLDQALIDQAEDPGALYNDECLDAYNFLKKESVQTAMRYRDLISACKNLHITKFEHAARARKNIKACGPEGEPDNVLAFFNKSFSGVMVGSQFRILEKIKDKHGKPDIRILSVPDFINRHSNRKMPDPSDQAKTVQASRFWMDSKDRLDLPGGIDFDPKPGRCRSDTYNLFQGFAASPKAGSWELLKRHVYEVLVSGNKSHGDYLLAWCAKILQKPWEKNITCPVLVSGQGAGKNTFIEAFGRILGQHFKTVVNAKGLSGQFNGHMKDCLLLFANEAIWGGDRQGAGQLKSIITDPTIRVEFKGKDSFEVDNYINLIVASNSSRAVPAEIGDRRFFVMEVSDCHKDDTAYFKALHAEINGGGVEAMMNDLLNMNLSGIDLRKIERTGGLMDQVVENMDTIDSYWFHCLNDGYLLPALFDERSNEIRRAHPWDKSIISKVQHDAYLDYCAENKMNHPKPGNSFGQFFGKLYPGMKVTRGKAGNNGKRNMCRNFPNLETCRRIYAEKVLGMDAKDVFKELAELGG